MTQTYQNIFGYDASPGLAALAALIFLLLSLVHLYQLVRTKTWYFTAFLVGGFFEVGGYLARAASAKQSPNYTIPPFAVAAVLVLVAPSLFAASMYMQLGRIIRATGKEKISPIRPSRLTKIFVIGDVIAFLAQAGGASMLAKVDDLNSIKRGTQIIKIGLIVQIAFFGLFIAVANGFHRRLNRTLNSGKAPKFIAWKKQLVNLYCASTLILLRCIYRFVEYVQGNKGYLIKHEWNMYAFDALLMGMVMVAMSFIHPSEVSAALRGGGLYTRWVFLTRRFDVPDDVEHVRIEIGGEKGEAPRVPQQARTRQSGRQGLQGIRRPQN